ncbi:hypothetical protein AF333_15675 [Aneurinibacillus migulanus]|uniref:NodB homology domain-containing protein n=1 Tax=Aneurinibacillus migulanus TaxID=47500 RepID=A0A0M0H3P6_ANEMI|nr:hypothetical protein AF333_15675 [Aneurinibacillus migulanus]
MLYIFICALLYPQLTPYTHYENKVLVLTYHHIDEKIKSDATITPKLFEQHMKKLRKYNYNVISMDEFIAFMKDNKSVPPNAVLLTFDDGYKSFYSKAYPTLLKYGYTATNFIIVKATDIPNPKALPHLTWKDMREMKRNGMSFYSHTYDQHTLCNVNEQGETNPAFITPIYKEKEKRMENEGEYQYRIEDDIQFANERLERELNNHESLLCFPFGAYNDTVLKIGRENNIRLFFTTQEGINKAHQEKVLRINAGAPNVSSGELIKKLRSYDE